MPGTQPTNLVRELTQDLVDDCITYGLSIELITDALSEQAEHLSSGSEEQLVKDTGYLVDMPNALAAFAANADA